MARFQIQERTKMMIDSIRLPVMAIAFAMGLGTVAVFGSAPEPVTNDLPLAPSEALKQLSLPSGFSASIIAAEPEIRQPIAMAFDDRGRLWVAECYSYADLKTNYDLHLRDRIVILEDSKGTGYFDKRKVFWDQGQRLTSIAPGFGGVFALCAPNLIFIPDRNGDDVPDGKPEVLLDGWDTDVVRHNIVNGLKWGPDGWLYGRHGILATSAVGKPGTPDSERVRLNAGIWRYHPTRKTFEVVCQGTTNPWGHDWDEYGNLLFINTVIGHLWQGIPGAYFERMFGEHLAPNRYGLFQQAADHYHWDTGKNWTESRNAAAGADALGGGHAHSGLMIYQGDNWPPQYRGELFTLNFHGRRINQDHLEQSGSGLVGRHRPDFVKFGDPWFRGVDLDYGPDGAVYVLDWSDTGECHGHDGVNRESGRIYRLTFQDQAGSSGKISPAAASLFTNSVASFSSEELIKLQSHPNEWFARHARRILQERAESDKLANSVRSTLLDAYQTEKNVAIKLRLFFTLHAIGADNRDWLTRQLADPDFHVRGWAVRFLAESGGPWENLVPLLTRQAVEDPAASVRLELASALQRVPAELREPLAAALVHHGEDAKDHNLPLMVWYGIEPIAATFPTNAVHLLAQCRIPIVREYISRRIGEQLASNSNAVELLLQVSTHLAGPVQADVLRGLAVALKGWRNPAKPKAWESFWDAVASSKDIQLLALSRELGLILGDLNALNQLKDIALSKSAAPQDRRSALEQLMDAHASAPPSALGQLLEDPITAGTTARGLLRDENPEMIPKVIEHWSKFSQDDRPAVVGALVARVSSTTQLLEAMAKGVIPRGDLTAFHARQIQKFNDPSLDRKLAEVWGQVRNSDADKKELMSHYRSILTPDRMKASNPSPGREIFTQTCAVCHKLYGQGAAIGPDLTGGGRNNLDYLLENIIDPSAIVPEDYRASEIELKDDRSLIGLVVGKNERTITIQTPTEKLTVDRSEISKMRQTSLSLMPEGLLQGLKEDQVCNLVAYLMTPNQVPLPAPQPK